MKNKKIKKISVHLISPLSRGDLGVCYLIISLLFILLSLCPCQTNSYTLPDEDLLEIAKQARETGKLEISISLFKEILEHNHNNNIARKELAYALTLDKKFKEALFEYHLLLISSPYDEILKTKLAELLNLMGKETEALNTIKEIPLTRIENTDSLITIGKIYESLKYNNLAFEYYKKAEIIAPHNFDVQMSIGKILEKKGNIQEAKQHFNSALKLNPLSKFAITSANSIEKISQHKLETGFGIENISQYNNGTHYFTKVTERVNERLILVERADHFARFGKKDTSGKVEVFYRSSPSAELHFGLSLAGAPKLIPSRSYELEYIRHFPADRTEFSLNYSRTEFSNLNKTDVTVYSPSLKYHFKSDINSWTQCKLFFADFSPGHRSTSSFLTSTRKISPQIEMNGGVAFGNEIFRGPSFLEYNGNTKSKTIILGSKYYLTNTKGFWLETSYTDKRNSFIKTLLQLGWFEGW